MAIQLATVDELAFWADDVAPDMATLVIGGVSASAIRIAAPVSGSWSSPDTVPDEVKLLVLQVAARVVANPRGLASESESVGGYAHAVTAPNVERGVSFTDAEKLALLAAAGLNQTPQGVRALSVTLG